MAIAQVQKVSDLVTAGTTVTVNSSDAWSTPTSGNLLILCVGLDDPTSRLDTTPPTPATWSIAVSAAVGTVTGTRIYYKVSDGTESEIVVTSSVSLDMRVTVFEYSGMDSSSPLDKTASATDGGSSVTSLTSGTTATTTQEDELAITSLRKGNTETPTWTNSFTQETGNRHYTSSKILSATGAQETTASWTTGSRCVHVIATFKASAAAPASFLPQIAMS